MTKSLAASLPPEWADAGAIYLEIVRDREASLAGYDYVAVQQLPPDVRREFIEEHFEDQQRANELIAFLKQDCAG